MRKTSIIQALGLNLVFLLLYIILGSCTFASLDDFFMSATLTGAYGSEYDVHLFFVNAVYGCFLKPFYWLFPKIGWYYLFEIGEVFVSLSVFVYFILKRVNGRKGVLLSLLLLSCLSPVFYFQFDFTKNAALLTASGMILILGNDCRKKILITGSLLLVAGFIMRKDAFFLGLPCLCILFIARYFRDRIFPKRAVLWILVSFAAIVCLFLFDRSLYQDNEYQYYAEYQQPRALFVDGSYYDSESSIDEIEELGLHGLDYSMMKGWIFYDTEVFCLDSLKKFEHVIARNQYDIFLTKMPFAVFMETARSLQNPVVWCWILFSFLLLLSSHEKISAVLPWGSLMFVIMSFTYLLLRNRLVEHVENSIWLYATVCMIPYIKDDVLNRVRISGFNQKALIFFIVLLFFGGYWNSPNHLKNSIFKVSSKNDLLWEHFFLYESNHSNEVFLMDFQPYKAFAKRLGGSYKTLEPGRLDKIFPLGYWNVHLPGMKNALKKLDIDNPMRSFLNANVRVLQYNEIQMYKDYYKLHLNQNVEFEKIPYTNLSGFDMVNFDMVRYYKKENLN